MTTSTVTATKKGDPQQMLREKDIHIYIYHHHHISNKQRSKTRKEDCLQEISPKVRAAVSVGPFETPRVGLEKKNMLAPPVGPLGRYRRARVCMAPMAEHPHGEGKN